MWQDRVPYFLIPSIFSHNAIGIDIAEHNVVRHTGLEGGQLPGVGSEKEETSFSGVAGVVGLSDNIIANESKSDKNKYKYWKEAVVFKGGRC